MKTHCTVKQGSSREFRLLIPLRTRPWPTRGLKTAGSRTPCFPDLLSRLLLNWNHGSVLECVSATLEKKVFNFRIYMYIFMCLNLYFCPRPSLRGHDFINYEFAPRLHINMTSGSWDCFLKFCCILFSCKILIPAVAATLYPVCIRTWICFTWRWVHTTPHTFILFKTFPYRNLGLYCASNLLLGYWFDQTWICTSWIFSMISHGPYALEN